MTMKPVNKEPNYIRFLFWTELVAMHLIALVCAVIK